MNAIKRRAFMCMFLSFLIVFMTFSNSIQAFAIEKETSFGPPEDFGNPVSVTTYIDEDGSGTGKYGYLFNKCAYVTFSCTATNPAGMSHDLSVTIRVSESGNTI